MSAIEQFIEHIQDLPIEKQRVLLLDMFNYSSELYEMRTEQIAATMTKIELAHQSLNSQAA